MNKISEVPDQWTLNARRRILDQVDNWTWPIIWTGNFDKKRFHFDGTSGLTEFIQIRESLVFMWGSEWFWILNFSDDIPYEDKMRRIQHDIAVTQFLNQSKKDQKLHSIIEPVKLLTFWNRKAPYIWKSIPDEPGWFYDEEDKHANNVLRIFWHHFIPDNLIELGIGCTETGFDIHGDNIITNKAFRDLLDKSRENSHHIDGMALLTNEWEESRKRLADEWASEWARIYLFDFGTWILPE